MRRSTRRGTVSIRWAVPLLISVALAACASSGEGTTAGTSAPLDTAESTPSTSTSTTVVETSAPAGETTTTVADAVTSSVAAEPETTLAPTVPTVALGCGATCGEPSSLPVTHPRLGAGTFSWYSADETGGDAGSDAAFSLSVGPVWTERLQGDDRAFLFGPATDATGRVLTIASYEGSGSCVLAWAPTDTGYAMVTHWGDVCGLDQRFVDPDGDGAVEIEVLDYGDECNVCAEWETDTVYVYRWNGLAYLRAETRVPLPSVPLAACVVDELWYAMDGHRDEIALYQYTLTRLGYDPGEIDGYFGRATLDAAYSEIDDNGVAVDDSGTMIEIFPDDGAILRAAFVRLGIAC